MNNNNLLMFSTMVIVLTIIGCSQSGGGDQSSQSNNPALGEVIAYRKITLLSHSKEGKYLQQTMTSNRMWNKNLSGLHSATFKGDRGERAGQFCGVWMFESLEKRDGYFPLTNKGDEHGTGVEEFSNVATMINNTTGNINYTYVPKESEATGVYTDYVVLGFDQLKNPTLGGLFALREYDIKPGMEAEFEEFCVNTSAPAFQDNFPGMEIYYLIGDRGARKGKYAEILSFESVDKRDYYFPTHDSTNAEIADEFWKMYETTNVERFLANPASYTDYFKVN